MNQLDSRTITREAGRRRSFAIISHPDAGKTTLTEKFLLYAGAIDEAGAVRSRRNRRAVVSDWMAMERERGISISSTVLRFDCRGVRLNLLDTPGHRDFSEDTYRVLAAVDAAIMVIDAAKGVESQTLKLFEVCRDRRVPLLTFVNKFDRPGREPLDLLDHIEDAIGLRPVPVTWPVGEGRYFEALVDRRSGVAHRFSRTSGGGTPAIEHSLDAASAAHSPFWHRATEELALLEAVGLDLDEGGFLRGVCTPVFFGSALTNFGVRLLLDAVVDVAPRPSARETATGGARPLDAPFSGFVFKLQANIDPQHRDRTAFLRVCSGQLVRGMTLTVARTGRSFTARHTHQVLGRQRDTLEEAFPGDVVGITGGPDLHIGDTLYAGDRVVFPPFATLAPEHFVVVRNRDSSRYKQFRRGLAQLDAEGVVQVLRDSDRGDQAPVLAGVGPMQFEVATHRLEHEFGAPVELQAMEHRLARGTDASGEEMLRRWGEAVVLQRTNGVRYALFRSEFWLDRFQSEHPEVRLDRLLVPAAP